MIFVMTSATSLSAFGSGVAEVTVTVKKARRNSHFGKCMTMLVTFAVALAPDPKEPNEHAPITALPWLHVVLIGLK